MFTKLQLYLVFNTKLSQKLDRQTFLLSIKIHKRVSQRVSSAVLFVFKLVFEYKKKCLGNTVLRLYTACHFIHVNELLNLAMF